MQIHCSVDQAEATRRGINSDTRADIEIDLALLTKAECVVLGNHLMGGNFKSPTTHRWPQIPEPTVKGLREKLTEMARDLPGCLADHGDTVPFAITQPELATVLAALRYYQRSTADGLRDEWIEAIATDGGNHAALGGVRIDALCEYLNCGG